MSATNWRKDPWMITSSGRRFCLDDPTVEMVDIYDIATHLSKESRFLGATRTMFPVAGHAVVVAEIIRRWGGTTDEQLEGLHHDDHEAYWRDMGSPHKVAMREYSIDTYSAFVYDGLVSMTDKVIREKFGLLPRQPDIVTRADKFAIDAERWFLVPDHPEWPTAYDDAYLPYRKFFSEVHWSTAKQSYLDTHHRLLAERGRSAV